MVKSLTGVIVLNENEDLKEGYTDFFLEILSLNDKLIKLALNDEKFPDFESGFQCC